MHWEVQQCFYFLHILSWQFIQFIVAGKYVHTDSCLGGFMQVAVPENVLLYNNGVTSHIMDLCLSNPQRPSESWTCFSNTFSLGPLIPQLTAILVLSMSDSSTVLSYPQLHTVKLFFLLFGDIETMKQMEQNRKPFYSNLGAVIQLMIKLTNANLFTQRWSV